MSMKAATFTCCFPSNLIQSDKLFNGLSMGRFLLGLLMAASFSQAASGQSTVTTDPVGFTTSNLLANSDTYLSFPFTRPFAFVGAISNVSGSPPNTISVAGAPGWASNQFVYAQTGQPNHYYVLIGPSGSSDPKEGHTYPITANSSSTLTVDTSRDDLSGVPTNAQVVIIPYWTPATLFPASNVGVSFTATTSPPTYKTLLRVPSYTATGTNLPDAMQYYFYNSAWRRTADGSDGSDDPLLPNGYIIVRNDNGAPTLPLISLGTVIVNKKVTTPLLTSASGQQDNSVGIVRPLDVALNATGLGPANGSFGPNDQLLVFNNSQPAFNKSAGVYYYDTSVGNSGGWRLAGDTTASTDHGADVIPAGAGFIVRKAQTAGGQTVFWPNAFPLRAASAVSRKVHGSAGTFDIALPLNQQFF